MTMFCWQLFPCLSVMTCSDFELLKRGSGARFLDSLAARRKGTYFVDCRHSLLLESLVCLHQDGSRKLALRS